MSMIRSSLLTLVKLLTLSKAHHRLMSLEHHTTLLQKFSKNLMTRNVICGQSVLSHTFCSLELHHLVVVTKSKSCKTYRLESITLMRLHGRMLPNKEKTSSQGCSLWIQLKECLPRKLWVTHGWSKLFREILTRASMV